LSYLANTQTNRQTNKVWQKHYLFGGGNKTYCSAPIAVERHNRLILYALTNATAHEKHTKPYSN